MVKHIEGLRARRAAGVGCHGGTSRFTLALLIGSFLSTSTALEIDRTEDGRMRVRWEGELHSRYTLEFSDDLAQWNTVDGFLSIPGRDQPMNFFEADVVPAHFYRLPRMPNRLPTSKNRNYSGDAGQAVSIVLRVDDEDGDLLTDRIETPPVHGALSGAAPNLIYTPDPGFVGKDTFTYLVHDSISDGSSSTITVTGTPNVTELINIAESACRNPPPPYNKGSF